MSLANEQVVDRFIPKRIGHKHTVDDWFNLIQTSAQQIEQESGKLSRSTVVAVYCAAARQLPLYGSAVFRVQHIGQWALPSELGTILLFVSSADLTFMVDIAVNAEGVQLLDPISKDKMKSLPFTHILRWFATTNGLSIVTGPRYAREETGNTLVLHTSQATQIGLILSLYFEHLLETINEVQALQDYTAKEAGQLSFKKGDILFY